jgi:agmatinase
LLQGLEGLLERPGYRLLRDPRDERISPVAGGVVALVGVPWDWSVTGRPGSREAPSSIRRELYGLTGHAPGTGLDLRCPITDLGDIAVAPGDHRVTGDRVRRVAERVFSEYRLAVFLGGDHSITLNLASGLLSVAGSIGILVMDAHYDLRSVGEGFTSGSWLWDLYTRHRGGVACAAVIGVSDYRNPAYLAERARELGVRVVTRRAVERGVEEALEAVDVLAGCGAEAYYLSIDMDHLDQAHAPGVNSPTALGMDPRDSVEILIYAADRLRPRGVDVVEVVPLVDQGNATSRLAAEMLAHVISAHEVCRGA